MFTITIPLNEWPRGCTRRWAAALALVASTFSVCGEEVMRARCLPLVGNRCQNVEVQKFMIDGQAHYIEYQRDGGMCSIKCGHTPLDDVAWPRFPRLVNCSIFVLTHCAPPAHASYMDALLALNMTASRSLLLLFMPADARVTALSLRDAPPDLKISTSAADGVLELQPGALANTGLQELNLERVHTDELPPNLNFLRMTNFSSETLPQSALDVQKLMIEDHKLLTVLGSIPHLRELTLTAPALESLTLFDGKMNILSPGFAQRVGRLHTLSLTAMEGPLPDGFLRGATQLFTFMAVACELTVLPSDLFNYSPKLELIDLSRNALNSLPPGLFSKIKQLERLFLTNNLLFAESLHALAPLTGLQELSLSGNPLADLCVPGGRSPLFPLQQLRALYLTSTDVTRLCADWLSDMRALADLDLRDNFLKVLPCDLRVVRAASVSDARIDLRGNDITRAHCKRRDYKKAVSNPVDTQRVMLLLQLPLKCNCDKAWFDLVVRERRITVAAPGGCSGNVPQHGCEDVSKV